MCETSPATAEMLIGFLSLADVSKISSRLVEDSKRFKWGAKRLNLLDAWKQYFPAAIVALIVVAVLYWRFLL